MFYCVLFKINISQLDERNAELAHAHEELNAANAKVAKCKESVSTLKKNEVQLKFEVGDVSILFN
jgi:hypothetical protein